MGGGNWSSQLSVALACIAAAAASMQSWVAWSGRNSHIELARHAEQLRACSVVLSKSLTLIDVLGAWQSAVDEKKDEAAYDERVERLIGELRASGWIAQVVLPEVQEELVSKLVSNIDATAQTLRRSPGENDPGNKDKRQRFLDERDITRSVFQELSVSCKSL